MSTDFFDNDLRRDQRVPAVAAPESTDQPADTISAHAISRLVLEKHERTTQMAGAVQEIELLRTRQRELEKEREHLESLTRRQESYEREKRESIANLERSLVLLDKQISEAMRASELMTSVRQRFEESLHEIKQIDENNWNGVQFETELNKAAVVIDQAQEQFKKGMSKVNSSGWFRAAAIAPVSDFEVSGNAHARPESFRYWLKAGLAFSLPLMVVIALCFVAWLVLGGGVAR
ncbi:MAG: hypothetical protein K8T26_05255 [Lentisphaerae bacterium]|nr:hypothetical protein [Lentisphaerota bacterium]